MRLDHQLHFVRQITDALLFVHQRMAESFAQLVEAFDDRIASLGVQRKHDIDQNGGRGELQLIVLGVARLHERRMGDEANVVDLELELAIAEFGFDGEQRGEYFVGEAAELS